MNAPTAASAANANAATTDTLLKLAQSGEACLGKVREQLLQAVESGASSLDIWVALERVANKEGWLLATKQAHAAALYATSKKPAPSGAEVTVAIKHRLLFSLTQIDDVLEGRANDTHRARADGFRKAVVTLDHAI